MTLLVDGTSKSDENGLYGKLVVLLPELDDVDDEYVLTSLDRQHFKGTATHNNTGRKIYS